MRNATTTHFKQKVCTGAGGLFYKKAGLSVGRPVGPPALESLQAPVSYRSVGVVYTDAQTRLRLSFSSRTHYESHLAC